MPSVFLAPTFGVGYQSFTDGGLPNNAGYIATYIANGTTPQATYTTAAGDVLNANPVVLSASGRPPSEIWLIVGQSYRFDLFDADGNLLKSYHDIAGGSGDFGTVTTNNITVAQDGDIEGDLTVEGDTHLLGDLTVDGESTFNDDVTINGDLEVTGLITNNGNPIYSGVPQNSQNAGYTLALLDQGKHINCATAGAFTIPANVTIPFPVGSIVSFYNPSAACTIAITSDTLRFAQDGTTGTRALAQYGIATILKVASTVWVISGQGVT